METLALLLAAAAAGHFAARALDLPAVPLLLIVGFLLGVGGMEPGPRVQESLLLGVTALLFIAGVELDPRRPQRQFVTALRVGVGQFVALAGLGVGVALLLGWDPLSATYLGLALSASSTLVVIRLLQRRREMFEPFGRLTVGVLLVQDLLLILLIPVIDRMTDGPGQVVQGVAGTLALVAAAWGASRWISPLLLRVERDAEVLLLAVLLQLAAFLLAVQLLGLPLMVGAFLAGVSLARFPVSAAVRPLLGSLGDFFTALFFTALGVLVGLPTVSELGQALVLVALLLVATPLLVAAVGEAAGLAARPAVEAGLLLAQASELTLVVGLLGLEREVLSPSAFTVLALVTALTMLLTPLIATERVTVWLLRWHPFTKPALGPEDIPPGGVLLLGAGSTGMPLLRTLREAGHQVIVVDDDPAVLERASTDGAIIVRGDAASRSTLAAAARAGVDVVVSTLRRAEDNRRVLRTMRDVPVLVRVFEEDEARWVQERGGIPVLTSDAAAETFMDWLATWQDGRPPQSSPSSTTQAAHNLPMST
jgi:Kef-type K+ transport system membrane component KefB